MNAQLEQAQGVVTEAKGRLADLNADKVRFHTNLADSEKLERQLRASRGDFRELARARSEIDAAKDLLADTEREAATVRAEIVSAEKNLAREQLLGAMLNACHDYREGQSALWEAFSEALEALRPHFDRLLTVAGTLDRPEQVYNELGKSALPGYSSSGHGSGAWHWTDNAEGRRDALEQELVVRGGTPVKPLAGPKNDQVAELLFQAFLAANARRQGKPFFTFTHR